MRGLARGLGTGNHQRGQNGFIVDSIDGAVEAVHRASSLDRHGVRAEFQQRFSVERMTRDYLAIYRHVAERGLGKAAAAA